MNLFEFFNWQKSSEKILAKEKKLNTAEFTAEQATVKI